jgi:hypothetical protein
MKRILTGAIVSGGLALSALAMPSIASADIYGPGGLSGYGCGGGGGSGGAFGSGGGYCDSPVDEFGNQFHCESVYVMGIGGQNCFWRHVG